MSEEISPAPGKDLVHSLTDENERSYRTSDTVASVPNKSSGKFLPLALEEKMDGEVELSTGATERDGGMLDADMCRRRCSVSAIGQCSRGLVRSVPNTSDEDTNKCCSVDRRWWQRRTNRISFAKGRTKFICDIRRARATKEETIFAQSSIAVIIAYQAAIISHFYRTDWSNCKRSSGKHRSRLEGKHE